MTTPLPLQIGGLRRRQWLQASAIGGLLGTVGLAGASLSTNVVEFSGEVRLNGARLRHEQSVQTGDAIETGPQGHLIFVIGRAAFQVRANTSLRVMRGATFLTVSELHVDHGGVVSVWAHPKPSRIVTPQVTVEVQQAGVYTEVSAPHSRTYCCNCFGPVQLTTNGETKTSHAEHHQSFWVDAPQGGLDRLDVAPTFKHSDHELMFLNQLLHQKPLWQRSEAQGPTDVLELTSDMTQGFLD